MKYKAYIEQEDDTALSSLQEDDQHPSSMGGEASHELTSYESTSLHQAMPPQSRVRKDDIRLYMTARRDDERTIHVEG